MKTFLIYSSNYEAIKDLPNEEAGKLLKAIFEYHITGEDPKLSGIAKMAFSFMKNGFDEGKISYEKKCEANRKNGMAGGRPKTKSENIPENPDGFQNIPKNLKNKNKNKNKNKDNINIIIKEKEIEIHEEDDLETKFKKSILIFEKHRKEKKSSFTETSKAYFLKRLGNLSGGNMEIAIEIINEAIGNNWTGIFPLSDNKPKKGIQKL